MIFFLSKNLFSSDKNSYMCLVFNYTVVLMNTRCVYSGPYSFFKEYFSTHINVPHKLNALNCMDQITTVFVVSFLDDKYIV